ncbi:MAG TPA: HlyD family type I secretion periplasmic adaptor subunit [Arenibaculum sp.]|nr:HlyD family type I secretion periplasmic adaptor subunit [Arenibaculum sp.]
MSMQQPVAAPAAAWRVTLDAEPPEPSLRRVVIAGTLAVAVGFGGFLGWAFTADLDSAAIATGTVMVDSHRKTVSHLEGGILHELLVREGDHVAVGQVLVRMDATQSRALVGQLRGQYWTTLARVGRLLAEQRDERTITFPEELARAGASSTVATEAMENEVRLMAVRWETHESQIAIQHRKIAQLHDEIQALRAQRKATADRLRYTEDELATVKALFEKGYERRPRLLDLQRSVAELEGRVGELAANESQAKQGIAAAELETVNLRNTRRTEVVDELQRQQVQAAELAERLHGANDILRRHEVTAPQAGKVTNLRFFTQGGVIPPGAPILDIVPQDDELVIEARIAPTDIDSVQIGQSAFVRLTAYRQRTMPPVRGEVIHVSADQLQDERQGFAYFAARVRLNPNALDGLGDVELYPGMPAEVMIRGHARKAIDYFLSPLTDSMRRAFREE